jgi:hypothetical protein
VLGLVVAISLVLVIAYAAWVSSGGSGPSTAAYAIKLILGVLFLLLALMQWRSGPAGEQAPALQWMAAIDTFGPGESSGLGAALSGVHPSGAGDRDRQYSRSGHMLPSPASNDGSSAASRSDGDSRRIDRQRS